MALLTGEWVVFVEAPIKKQQVLWCCKGCCRTQNVICRIWKRQDCW